MRKAEVTAPYYCLEPRHADGSLNVAAISDGHGPPFLYGTLNAIFDLFFTAHPTTTTASKDALHAWLQSKGWAYRPVTWDPHTPTRRARIVRSSR